MSDDRSGPEDEEEEDDASAEAKAEWRMTMARQRGLDPATLDGGVLRAMRWRENVVPLWRSDQVCLVCNFTS